MPMTPEQKEQVQKLVLLGMWLVGGLWALYQFVLVPFFKERGQSAGELEKLLTQIKKAEVAMEGESRVRREFVQALGEFQVVVTNHVVPAASPDMPARDTLWAQEKVRMYARRAGVEVITVHAEAKGAGGAGWDQLVKGDRTFRPYAVRISLVDVGYADMMRLIGEMERDNPYLCVMELVISGTDRDPARHQVSLVVEWPMWGKKHSIGSATDRAAKARKT